MDCVFLNRVLSISSLAVLAHPRISFRYAWQLGYRFGFRFATLRSLLPGYKVSNTCLASYVGATMGIYLGVQHNMRIDGEGRISASGAGNEGVKEPDRAYDKARHLRISFSHIPHATKETREFWSQKMIETEGREYHVKRFTAGGRQNGGQYTE